VGGAGRQRLGGRDAVRAESVFFAEPPTSARPGLLLLLLLLRPSDTGKIASQLSGRATGPELV